MSVSLVYDCPERKIREKGQLVSAGLERLAYTE